jgi:site-specific DNA-methyltransferase (adenine-specific)
MATKMNMIHNMDCLEFMKQVPDNYFYLTVTSPPYDNLRAYKGYTFDWKMIVPELYRTTKEGGVVVWNVGDETVDGSESLTSFRQALYFNEIGFNVHDTMIYEKNSSSFPARADGNRYTQIFEYVFIFSKGKPKTSNLLIDKKNKWAGHSSFDGKIQDVPEYSPRNNIWKYTTSLDDRTEHPAIMPIELAKDHIRTWSNAKDVVFDPFSGSGTTAKASIELSRRYIGTEISSEYVEIAKKRLEKVQGSLF